MANRALGRYDRIADSTHPGPDLPRAPRSMRSKIEIVEAAIPDPTNIGKEKLKRQRAAVNRLTDLLEYQRERGLISESAYLWGRSYMHVCDGVSTGCSKPVFELSDGGGDRDKAMASRLDKARTLVRWDSEIKMLVGQWQAFIVRSVLRDGAGFGELAIAVGYRSSYGRHKIGKEFRESIEIIAEKWDYARA